MNKSAAEGRKQGRGGSGQSVIVRMSRGDVLSAEGLVGHMAVSRLGRGSICNPPTYREVNGATSETQRAN